jgi:Phage tail tube protein
MALVKPIGFADFVLTLGDGATPTEVFAAPCAFSARALNLTKNLNEIVVPDCSDENKPGWIVRDPLSISWDITGEGLLDEGSIDTWDEWFLQTGSKSVKVTMTTTTGTIVYTGKGHLQTWNRTAARGEELTYSVAIAGSGVLTRTPPAVMMTGASFMDTAGDTAEYMEMREARRARHAEPPVVKHSKTKEKTKEPA